jgi:CMP-N-acetylneuraminic acid synthetase
MKIVSIIPIKLNNERFPGKNIKEMADGRPLISHILNTLSKVDKISERYVFCSDDEIKNYLTEDIMFLKRDKVLDESTSNFTQIFDSFKKKVDADIYVFTHATAPFLSEKTINECIDKVVSGEYDSAFTAKMIRDFVWINGQPNYDTKNIPRTQDLVPILVETSGMYVFTKKVWETRRSRIGGNPYICKVSEMESVDINYPDDFELANAWLAKKKEV